MKRTLLLLFFLVTSLYSQEAIETETTPEKKSPQIAALLGWIPGLGQAYIGNYGTAGFQAMTYLTLRSARTHFYSQPDYIEYKNRQVRFEWTETVIGYEFEKHGQTYLDYPLFTETKYERSVRLARQGRLAEQNPLFKYREYSRTSRNSFYSDELSNPVLSTLFYSVYSSYRDAGGLGDLAKQETIGELAMAPFSFSILKDPKVWTPIALALLLAPMSATSDSVTLAPKSLIRDGSLYGGAFVTGISPAIGEEAFFRGYLNYSMTRSMGPWVGGGISGFVFGLAHAGNPDSADNMTAAVLPRVLMGFYFSYLHHSSGYDIKPGIAVHFWWNFIISLSMIQKYKADPLYNKSQREVNMMPIVFQQQF
jgi:membrane protease YdiL (CAAX protease family)